MNIQQMMKQAQQMQKKLQQDQENLEKMEFEGKSANGLVNVRIMGTYLVKSLSIDKSLIDSEEKEILEDLITVALNEAIEKIKKTSDETMNSAAGGLDPKKFKLPF